jgi:hypothetical protein
MSAQKNKQQAQNLEQIVKNQQQGSFEAFVGLTPQENHDNQTDDIGGQIIKKNGSQINT